jgi:hypothetical protein
VRPLPAGEYNRVHGPEARRKAAEQYAQRAEAGRKAAERQAQREEERRQSQVLNKGHDFSGDFKDCAVCGMPERTFRATARPCPPAKFRRWEADRQAQEDEKRRQGQVLDKGHYFSYIREGNYYCITCGMPERTFRATAEPCPCPRP